MVVVLWFCIFVEHDVLRGGMRDVATHGRFERSTVADYVIMFIVLLSNCIRIRHYARSAIAEGGDRVAIGCSWRLKRCGQVVELVVIGCGSILD